MYPLSRDPRPEQRKAGKCSGVGKWVAVGAAGDGATLNRMSGARMRGFVHPGGSLSFVLDSRESGCSLSPASLYEGDPKDFARLRRYTRALPEIRARVESDNDEGAEDWPKYAALCENGDGFGLCLGVARLNRGWRVLGATVEQRKCARKSGKLGYGLGLGDWFVQLGISK